MKQEVSSILWTCDHNNCKEKATSYDKYETPPGWTSFTGAMQTPSGGGPATLDLCTKHANVLHKTYSIHTDIDEDDD